MHVFKIIKLANLHLFKVKKEFLDKNLCFAARNLKKS